MKYRIQMNCLNIFIFYFHLDSFMVWAFSSMFPFHDITLTFTSARDEVRQRTEFERPLRLIIAVLFSKTCTYIKYIVSDFWSMRQTLFCISSFITGYLERYRFYDMYIVTERYICVYIYIYVTTNTDRSIGKTVKIDRADQWVRMQFKNVGRYI